MILVSKNGEQIINFDNVTNIFVKEGKIAVNQANGSGSCIGIYQSAEEARAALLMVAESLKLGRSARFPDEKAVKGWMVNQQLDKTEIHHYNDGKKTKGYGKS